VQVKTWFKLKVGRDFKNRLFIPYLFLGLSLQLVSLFRKYPLNHPCGKILSISENLNVLINCDSAVFMKDAQEPSRLFDGQSVYQDRPLPTLLVSTLSKAWHLFNLPDYYRNVVGNSGISYTYSIATYLFFLIINIIIFIVACWVSLKIVINIFVNNGISFVYYPKIAILMIMVVSLNEISKTFFWTPHSQMFNLLLPTYLFYLLQYRRVNVSSKFYIINSFIFLAMLFSYAFFVLLALPMLLIYWKNIKTRIFVIALILATYLVYPIILNMFGGKYYSIGFEKYRLFIWLIDAIKHTSGAPSILDNLIIFIETFPSLPVILIILAFLYFIVQKKVSFLEAIAPLKMEFFSLLLYFLMLSTYGYYARRLTYPLIIFLILILVKFFLNNFYLFILKSNVLAMGLFVFFILSSWVLTNGPLV
jgi:hypothetical protein